MQPEKRKSQQPISTRRGWRPPRSVTRVATISAGYLLVFIPTFILLYNILTPTFVGGPDPAVFGNVDPAMYETVNTSYLTVSYEQLVVQATAFAFICCMAVRWAWGVFRSPVSESEVLRRERMEKYAAGGRAPRTDLREIAPGVLLDDEGEVILREGAEGDEQVK